MIILFQLIKSDYNKYLKYGGNFFSILFLTQGFWAIFQYRIAHSIYVNVRWKPLRFVVMTFIMIWKKVIEIMTGISIPASVVIGKSFYIGHFSGIMINANAIIGNNCNISQGVTIGVSGINENRGVPIIGDSVYIGANAVVVGKITIGNSVLISANSLVNRTVFDNEIVMGVPAVVFSHKGSKGYI